MQYEGFLFPFLHGCIYTAVEKRKKETSKNACKTSSTSEVLAAIEVRVFSDEMRVFLVEIRVFSNCLFLDVCEGTYARRLDVETMQKMFRYESKIIAFMLA